MGKTLEKRTSRARVLLDIEDMRLLSLLVKYGKNNQVFIIEGLKKEMNISHNSLLVHIKRLGGLGLIISFRNPESYKNKIIHITDEGKKIFDILTDHKTVSINGNKVELWK
jgi:DNA-binding MarR family transcriptional regulator